MPKTEFLCVPDKNQLINFGINYVTSSSMLVFFLQFGPLLGFKIKVILGLKSYNSVEGYRSNPVLAVKRSLFVEIRFLRSIFF